tara:strand:+ start:219 stop:1082 length:864 start_codon:yes stop_codon:yes gene_type:complete
VADWARPYARAPLHRSLQSLLYGTDERAEFYGTGLDLRELRSLLYQLLSALCYCHEAGVVHGNIAPYRILAAPRPSGYAYKLTDFRFSPPDSQEACSRLSVRASRAAPETDSANVYTRACDVWALAAVAVEAACGGHPASLHFNIRSIGSVESGCAMLREYLPECMVDLLSRMLLRDDKCRSTAEEALSHRFFNGIRESCPMAATLPCTYLRVPAKRPVSFEFQGRQQDVDERCWCVAVSDMHGLCTELELDSRSLQLACSVLRRCAATKPHLPGPSAHEVRACTGT